MTDNQTTSETPDEMLERAAREKWTKHFGPYDENAMARYSTYDMEAKKAEIARLRAALKPFANLADTWTVATAANAGSLLTLSNGRRMCGIEAAAFVKAAEALAP